MVPHDVTDLVQCAYIQKNKMIIRKQQNVLNDYLFNLVIYIAKLYIKISEL